MFKIAVDAMGGDYSPGEVVRGSVISARESELGIILVGQKDKIEFELSKYNIDGLDIQIVHTD
jgi:phosphate acyltransferase